MHDHPQPPETKGMLIRWAWSYDLLLKLMTFGFEGRFRRRLVDIARLQSGERVLDAGCGTGTLALAAANRVGADGAVHGIDPAPEMVARARKKASRAGAAIEFEVGLLESLPFADASLDVVLSTLVFHHLPDDDLRRQALAEIRRVLAPGGRMLIVDFGEMDRLASEARDAGFATVETGKLRPRVLRWLLADGTAG